MLLEFIERMRTRPERDRMRLALLAAGVFTAVIALGWVVTLPVRFAQVPEDESAGASSLGIFLGTASNSFVDIRERAADTGASVKEALELLGDSLSGEVEFSASDEVVER